MREVLGTGRLCEKWDHILHEMPQVARGGEQEGCVSAWRPRVQGYKRQSLDGYSFASKLEAALYLELKLREKAKEIVIEKVQDHLRLSEAEIGYIADFRIRDLSTGEQEWLEAKGFESDRWPIIKKLWAAYGPGRLRIFKGTYRTLKQVEVITPKPRQTNDVDSGLKNSMGNVRSDLKGDLE